MAEIEITGFVEQSWKAENGAGDVVVLRVVVEDSP